MVRYAFVALGIVIGCGGSSSSSPTPTIDAAVSDVAPAIDAASCTGFCREPLPVGTEILKAVWGTSANDVWAVGLDGVIVHSDGVRWTASASGTTKMLNGVWGSGPADVWAAGGDTAGPVLLHYDGKAWTPATTTATKTFTGVYASSATDAWAVTEIGEVAHFDGASWKLEAPTAGVAWGIHGTSATDVWIPASEGRTWHGGTGGFSPVATPITTDSITSIFALSPTEAFAVGFHQLFLHFTGGAWKVVRAPGGGKFVWSVSATAPNDVWMAGNGGYVQRWNGTKFEYFDIERVGTRTFDKHFHGVWATTRDVFLVGQTAIFHLRR
jgi:hypothetical protein